MRATFLKPVGLILLVLGTFACSGGDTAPAPTQAIIAVSPQSNPITAQRCSPLCSGAAFAATTVIFLQESAGIGGTVTSVVFTPPSAIAAPINLGPADILRFSSITRVVGHGNWIFPFAFVYNTPSGTANMLLTFTIAFTDDNGNKMTAVGSVTIV